MKLNNFIKLILIVLVILFGIYVWPTPYMYISGGLPGSDRQYNISKNQIFRINRITGKGEIWLKSTGWKVIK
jgi:hypothetical protein